MYQYRERRSMFKDKTCQICRKQATIYRVTSFRHTYLCDSSKCDFMILVKHGIIAEDIVKV